jgi:hypothetical protein
MYFGEQVSSDGSGYAAASAVLHEPNLARNFSGGKLCKRPRITFSNKQIVQLEKEFHYNKSVSLTSTPDEF